MLNQLFRWQSGRQQSGYDKLLLAFGYWPIKFDCYLLRFPTGSEIKPHTDNVTQGKHYRLNIVLKKAKIGGEFICHNPLFQTNRIKLFRPDISTHQVLKITAGTRYLLSFGWVLQTKK
ncbi:2OG-Fe(II) oxygenase [Algibacillus agarilyticus]|uniref:2OG-Fe(II) oxygenase n=1 Tax=Algibacillus agarilyticus TaxID=2234133 RepID=UPI000DD0CF3B|nr:2OG-Fe(II) oxygenase [Algibacillus agarilyticus]